MSIKVKKSGAWQNVRNGGVAVRGGGAWYFPGKVHRKMGAYGGGYWTDSGYRGAPQPPTGFAFTGWTYSKVNASWNNPGGSVPIQQYHYEITDVNNTPMLGWHTSSTYFNMTDTGHSLGWDTRYHARVRSLSYEGLYSNWAYIRFGIGHPAQFDQRWVVRERNWFQYTNLIPDGYGYRDEPHYIVVPSRVRVDACRIFFKATWEAGWLSLPDQARRIYPLRNTAIKFEEGPYFINQDPANYYWLPWVEEWSNNGQFGVYIWGDGWSSRGAGPYGFTGSFELYGIEQYDELETYQSVYESGNYYW